MDSLDSAPQAAEEVSPANSELAERAVLYASSLPGRTKWAAQTVDGAEATASSSKSSEARGVIEKLPTPDDQSTVGVMLKFYDLSASEALQVADLVEVVGVLGQGSLPNSDWASAGAAADDANADSQEQAVHPALHVVLHEKVSDVWTSKNQAPQPTLRTADAAISHLSQAVCGDRSAAEWLLLSLLASIHTRKAPFALGHLSLRLLLPPTAEVSCFEPLLSSMLPAMVPIDLSLTTLNDEKVRFSPRSDSSSSLGLHAGRLQLAKGTTVLVKENMAEGRLSSHGLENLKSLSNVIKHSTLHYDFPYSPQPYALPVDLGFVMLSGGKQGDAQGTVGTGGLIETDVDVVVESSQAAVASQQLAESSSSSSSASSDDSSLPALRCYLNEARRLARTLTVSSEVAEEIQQDFVSSRSNSGGPSPSAAAVAASSASQEDLLRRMDIARLLAAARLRSSLEFADYRKAREMDEQRLLALEKRKENMKANAGAAKQASSASSSSAAASAR